MQVLLGGVHHWRHGAHAAFASTSTTSERSALSGAVCAALLSAWGCLLRVSAARQCTGLGSASARPRRDMRSAYRARSPPAMHRPLAARQCPLPAVQDAGAHATEQHPYGTHWCVHGRRHGTSTARNHRVHAPDPRRRCARHSASRMAIGSDARLARRIDEEWKSEACSGACGARR
jgi:hypothetical protein